MLLLLLFLWTLVCLRPFAALLLLVALLSTVANSFIAGFPPLLLLHRV
jgi:hypothetical protein